MKQDLESVEALFNRASNLAGLKRDYVSDVRKTTMYYTGDDGFGLALDGESNYRVNDNALSQMAAWAHMPMSYVNFMRNNGHHQLVVDNFNQWFEKPDHVNSSRRLYRGMAAEFSDNAGVWRSFHSDKFQRIDHEHILEDLLPALEELEREFGELKIASCDITDNKMYLKVTFPDTEATIVGDVVRMGLSIGNSEIGKSTAFIQPLLYILRCTNGMVSPHRGVKRRHIGSAIEGDGEITYEEDTIEANLKAIKLQLRDSMSSVMQSFKDGTFVEEIKKASEGTPVKQPMKAVEATAKLFGLTEKEKETATFSFAKLGKYNKWGMMNAVTDVANTSESYDRASELEVFGGKILTLSNTQWDSIALAA